MPWFSLENCFRKALDVSQSRALHSPVEKCFRKALQVKFMKPLSHASRASHTSHFAICLARSPMPRPAACKARSSVKWGCAPRVVERQPLFVIQLSKINLAHTSATFQVRKHTFKASVACNGREVLRGTPVGRHGISAIEAADCLGNREPTIHWKVSRTSAACRVGSRKHLSPSAMRSEPVGRTPGDEVTLRLAGITCPLINSRQNRGCVQ